MKKIDLNSLTTEQIEKELKRTKYNNGFSHIIMNTIIVFIIIAAIGTLVATFLMPVLQLNTDAMNGVYKSGDIVVSVKTNNIKPNDIIAYYYGNKILISRVVGVSGDTIDIDKNGKVYRNNQLVENDNFTNIDFTIDDIKYPTVVQSEEYFVLNDDRKDTSDSRNKEIGNIKKENLIGKVLFKVWSK